MTPLNAEATHYLSLRLLPTDAQQICGFIYKNAPLWKNMSTGFYYKPEITGLVRALQVAPYCQKVFVHFNRRKLGDPLVGTGEFQIVTLALELFTGRFFASGGERILPDRTLQITNALFFLRKFKGQPGFVQLESAVSYWGIFKHKLSEPCCSVKRRLTYEYANGGDLQSILEKSHLTNEQKKILFEDLVKTFTKLHREKIVHHDIKAENILLSNQDRRGLKAIVGDFGAMKDLNQTINIIGYDGSDWYWSPEYALFILKFFNGAEIQFDEFKKVNGFNRDQWSLGLTLMILLNDRFAIPWQVIEDTKEIAETLASLQENWLTECPDPRSPYYVVRKLLSVDPEKRPPLEAVEQMLPQLNWT